MKTFTSDHIAARKIRVAQSREGYRFNLDSVLLAYFVDARNSHHLVELGCGNGVVMFLIAARFPNLSRCTAIDCDPHVIDIARQNLSENSWIRPDLIHFEQGDWRDVPHLHGDCDIAVSNPPWYAAGSGRINPDAGKAAARHELHGDLGDWAVAAGRILQPKGRLFAAFRAERLIDLTSALRTQGLEPKRLRFVYDTATDSAKTVLIEAVKGGNANVETLAPLIVRDADGAYGPEVAAMLDGRNLPI